MNLSQRFIFFLIVLFTTASVWADGLPEPMSPPRLVNDFANVFNAQQKNDLEQMLRDYNDSTSTQIYVVTLPDLQGYAASDFAPRLAEKWKIGQKGKNNGALILIKPKTSDSRGDVFIATGYGLEEKLTDGRIGRILDNDMMPYLRRNDYYSGTKASIESMITYLSGQFQGDENNDDAPSLADFLLTMFLIIAIIIIISKITRGNKGNQSRGGGFFPPMGGFGKGGSGGFGGGGSFGGGGGGSFGGGGAGRSW